MKKALIVSGVLLAIIISCLFIENSESYINEKLNVLTLEKYTIEKTDFKSDFRIKDNKLYIKIIATNADIQEYNNFQFFLNDNYPVANLKFLDKNGFALAETKFTKNDIIIDGNIVYFLKVINMKKEEAKNIENIYLACINALLK